MISEHHVLENLYGEWCDDALHVQPLLSYLRRDIGAAVPAGLPVLEMAVPPEAPKEVAEGEAAVQ